jgi:hypothetical protein
MLGAENTVGDSTLDGWTARQLARMFVFIWVSSGSPDANLPLAQRIVPAVRLLTFARVIDPHDTVTSEDMLVDYINVWSA